MECKNCGASNAPLKKVCENCQAFLEGWAVNNVTGKIGYRHADGSFTPDLRGRPMKCHWKDCPNVEDCPDAGNPMHGPYLEAAGTKPTYESYVARRKAYGFSVCTEEEWNNMQRAQQANTPG